MFSNGLVRLCIGIAATVAFALPALGQHATASVNGTITDSSGSLVPGASVVLTNVDTNVAARAKTNGSGYFAFVDVAPGQYTMTVTKANFKRVVLPVFHLVVDQTLTENETLSVGEENQTVTVNASAEGVMLERSSSELGNADRVQRAQNSASERPQFRRSLPHSLARREARSPRPGGRVSSPSDAGISAIPGLSVL